MASKTFVKARSRLEIVPKLVDAAIAFAHYYGREQVVTGLPGPVQLAEHAHFMVIFRTPKAMALGCSNFGIDVWYEGKKVLNVSWNFPKLKDYEIVGFEPGPWITEFLDSCISM